MGQTERKIIFSFYHLAEALLKEEQYNDVPNLIRWGERKIGALFIIYKKIKKNKTLKG